MKKAEGRGIKRVTRDFSGITFCIVVMEYLSNGILIVTNVECFSLFIDKKANKSF